MVNWTDPFNTGNPGVVEVRTRASLSWLQLLGFTACEITTPNCEHVPRWMRTERILPRVTALHRIGLVTTKGGKWTQVPMTLVGESEPMSLEGMLARARYRNDVAGFFK